MGKKPAAIAPTKAPAPQRFEKPACPYCRAFSRSKFIMGSGGKKNSRLQHSRFRVCENDHGFVYKRG